MKKIILCILAAALIVTAAGCGSIKTNASEKAQSIARQAVECVDDYLDGKISGKQAKEQTQDLYEQMDYVSDMSRETEEENKTYIADFSIRISLGSLRQEVSFDYYDQDSESYDKVIEARNNLAEEIGMGKR